MGLFLNYRRFYIFSLRYFLTFKVKDFTLLSSDSDNLIFCRLGSTLPTLVMKFSKYNVSTNEADRII